jgi:hypothetical protein
MVTKHPAPLLEKWLASRCRYAHSPTTRLLTLTTTLRLQHEEVGALCQPIIAPPCAGHRSQVGGGGILDHGSRHWCASPNPLLSLPLLCSFGVSGLQGDLGTCTSAHELSAIVYRLSGQGEVWAWGGNEKGQLGLGDRTRRTSPALLTDLSSITRIAWYIAMLCSCFPCELNRMPYSQCAQQSAAENGTRWL